jgi:hypothetical protein
MFVPNFKSRFKNCHLDISPLANKWINKHISNTLDVFFCYNFIPKFRQGCYVKDSAFQWLMMTVLVNQQDIF